MGRMGRCVRHHVGTTELNFPSWRGIIFATVGSAALLREDRQKRLSVSVVCPVGQHPVAEPRERKPDDDAERVKSTGMRLLAALSLVFAPSTVAAFMRARKFGGW